MIWDFNDCTSFNTGKWFSVKRNFSMAILDSIAIEKKMYWFPLQWKYSPPQNLTEQWRTFVFEKKIPVVCGPICVCSSLELCWARIYYSPTSIILTPNLLYWNKWNMFNIFPSIFSWKFLDDSLIILSQGTRMKPSDWKTAFFCRDIFNMIAGRGHLNYVSCTKYQ